MRNHASRCLMLLVTSVLAPVSLMADERGCRDLPSHAEVKAALTTVVASKNNGGLGFNMWATVVNRDGEVCVVVFTGSQRGNQWPGSRLISAQKANTWLSTVAQSNRLLLGLLLGRWHFCFLCFSALPADQG